MNEIEMAIDAIETAFEQEPILEQGYEFYVVIKESLTTALAALREKAEREKGCEYCWDDEDNEPEHIGIGTDEWGRECGYLVIGEETFQVNFCPMCGKRLEEHHDAD